MEAEQAQVQAETEQMRNAILSAVSMIYVPLVTIMGAASGLLEDKGTLDSDTRQELAKAICEASTPIGPIGKKSFGNDAA